MREIIKLIHFRFNTVVLVLLCCWSLSYAQVGINTTNPYATLDIRSSDQTAPTHTDGILIPKADNFPLTNPTLDQDGMMLFITGNSIPNRGFYYWDNASTSWVLIAGASSGGNTLDQAYDQGGVGQGKNINATDGAVRINGEDGFLITGVFGNGNTIDTEITGDGVRLFFNPNKAAFRAGRVVGNYWDDLNIGSYSSALGFSTTASGTGSSAFGLNTVASGIGSNAFGQNSIATQNYATAFGQQTSATGYASTAFGNGNIASESSSSAFGDFTTASGASSTTFGLSTQASGFESMAYGFGTLASGDDSTAFGFSTTASDFASTAFGIQTAAIGEAALAFGVNTTAADYCSTAFGLFTTATGFIDVGPYSVGGPATAFGFGTVASGSSSTAFGANTQASGGASTAFGSGTIASGSVSTSFGSYNTASAYNATAFGINNIASEMLSTTFGQENEASGVASLAFGQETNATAINATAFGFLTTASSAHATAFGQNTLASGYASTSYGIGTVAPSSYETAIGMFNTTYTPLVSGLGYNLNDKLFVVGNGIDNANRSNAFTIYKNGIININDAYNLPLADGTANQVLTTNGTGDLSFQDINVSNTVYSLNQSYSLGGTGAGRIINAIYGPVEIRNNGGLLVESANQAHMLFVDGINDEIGISTASPTANLSVNGTANKPGGGTWAVFSDARLKENISNYTEGLDLITNVRPVNFSYNDKMRVLVGDNKSLRGRVYQGVIAQDLLKVAPDMVREVILDSGNYYEVDPNKFTYALINAVKEQQQIIENQNNDINYNTAQIENLQLQIKELKQVIVDLLKKS